MYVYFMHFTKFFKNFKKNNLEFYIEADIFPKVLFK